MSGERKWPTSPVDALVRAAQELKAQERFIAAAELVSDAQPTQPKSQMPGQRFAYFATWNGAVDRAREWRDLGDRGVMEIRNVPGGWITEGGEPRHYRLARWDAPAGPAARAVVVP